MKMKEYLRLRNIALSPRDWRGMMDYISPMNRAERRRAKRRGKKKKYPGAVINTRGQ